jgi:hypothetical protein
MLVMLLEACSDARSAKRSRAPYRVDGGTTIRLPEQLTSIETGRDSPIGTPMRTACPTCHTLREPAPLPQSPDELKTVHAGLQFLHGELQCASCHEPGRFDRLHLASAETIPLEDALKLCAQCHGPQWRDYRHGSHGGMTGYWDLSRGPRSRNHCVDCHDPHAPRYPGALPVFAPRDRIPPNRSEPHHG